MFEWVKHLFDRVFERMWDCVGLDTPSPGGSGGSTSKVRNVRFLIARRPWAAKGPRVSHDTRFEQVFEISGWP